MTIIKLFGLMIIIVPINLLLLSFSYVANSKYF